VAGLWAYAIEARVNKEHPNMSTFDDEVVGDKWTVREPLLLGLNIA
jgi:hypothetical protein